MMPVPNASTPQTVTANETMKALSILVLGGTGFIGPHQLRYAVARGHRVTVFNRGRSTQQLPDGVEALHGDRDANDYAALSGRSFDVCIDNACSVPHWIRDAAALLQGRVGHYVYISTISVYADGATPGQDESAPRVPYDSAQVMSVKIAALRENMALYGPLKACCEYEVQVAYREHCTIIRPGLIVGPGDATDRFTYWPVRIARGGNVLTPPLADPVQLIDVRDLAEWTIRIVENRTRGTFNATGPDYTLDVGTMLNTVRDAIQSDAKWCEVSADFLQEHRVSAWQDLPVWIPGQGESAGFHRRSNARAVAAGLRFRPLEATAADTLAWWQQHPEANRTSLKTGLSAAREASLLAQRNT
jgi:2'-hydroxyisoflavone reductase